MPNPHNLQVGQELFYVPDDSRDRPRTVTITKIGRLWATMNRGPRIDLETFRAHPEGFSSRGQCYLSQEEYEREAAADNLWRKAKTSMPYSRPEHITSEAIIEAARLLGLDALIKEE